MLRLTTYDPERLAADADRVAEVGRQALGPVVDDLLGQLVAAPSQLLGAGPVIDPGPLGAR